MGRKAGALLWRVELRTYSPDLEENSLKSNFSHMLPAAASVLLGPGLPTAKSEHSSLQKKRDQKIKSHSSPLSHKPYNPREHRVLSVWQDSFYCLNKHSFIVSKGVNHITGPKSENMTPNRL